MKIVLSWLRDYCEWNWSLEELVEQLTMSGTEVESITETGFSLDHFVTAKVESFVPHPNADRLRLCKVNDGDGIRQIVCGASNFEEGDTVALAQPGATMPAGFKIKKSKLRGELSEGMMCSSDELGLPSQGDDKGIMILDQTLEAGMPLKDVFEGETVLECEVTPNRSDLLSYRGLSREMQALGAAVTEFKFPDLVSGDEKSQWEIDVEDTESCPRYTATYIEGVEVGDSPEWLQAYLNAAGLRPVNNIVDITNFVLLETGQPLHAFDANILSGSKIIIRKAKENEEIVALDGKTYELNEADLVIADETSPVAIAGVMGGELSGVTEKTTSIILESARFDPLMVRTTSRRLGLISDSSYRFERGIDPAAVDLAAARAIQLILKLCGGKVSESRVESATYEAEENVVPLRLSRVKQVLGFEMAETRIAEILEALGCSKSNDGWSIPSYRLDLNREIDLIEELARFEGLRSVEAVVPGGVSSRGKADIRYETETALRRRLTGLGYYEVTTTSLVPAAEEEESGRVVIGNPLVMDSARLRKSLLETVLPSVRHNLGQGNENLKLFEMGTVYEAHKGRSVEKRRIVVLGVGKSSDLHWSGEPELLDYYDIKGVYESLSREFSGVQLTQKKVICGLVAPEQLKAFGIKVPVWFAEWDISKAKRSREQRYQPLPEYPAVKRDLAFLAKRETAADQIEEAIHAAGVAELESVCCFDIFTDDKGERLERDKKSIAYALTYRSPERTLKDKEVAAWDQKIVKSVEKATGAVLR